MLLAQTVAAQSNDLKMADCVRVLRADSVHLFFDKQYALVPPDCADTRREAVMSTQGNFVGEVRDYQIINNGLLTKIHYADGLRDGSYEHYYPNQQLAVAGQFSRGQPVGTWYYWHANGQPWQTLQLASGAPLRIVAHADSTGLPHVTNGNGIWEERQHQPVPTYGSGRVAGELMDGTWELRGVFDKQLMFKEVYRQGQLQAGLQYVGVAGKPKKYTNARWIGPQAVDASAAIEPFRFGMRCEMKVAAQQASAQNVASLAAVRAATKSPQPPTETRAYQRELLRRLNAFNNATLWMPRVDGQAMTVTADIDETGRLSNFASETAVLASALATITTTMGPWRPAMVGAIAVPGKLRFTLRMHSTQLQSSLAAYPAYPLPSAAVQVFKK